MATRLVVWLLFQAAMPCASAGQQQPPLDSNRPEKASQAAPEPAQLDIARIRKLLGEPRPPASEGGTAGLATTFTVVSTPQPVPADLDRALRFKDSIDVTALRWNRPTFAEQLEDFEKRSRYPYIYAPSLQELASRVPDLQYLHPVNAAMAVNKAIRGALYRSKVGKARREVEAELQAIKAHNAAQAAADSKPAKQR